MPPRKRSAIASDKYKALAKALYGVKVEGRPIVELFLEIPDANLYPDYTKIVDEPISLAEIGKRIKNGTYTTDSEIVKDLEKMVANAKLYNGEESAVYDDAVDILDFVLLWLGRDLSEDSRIRLQLTVLNELENFKSKGRKISDAFIVEPDVKLYPNYRDIVKKPSSFTTVRKQLTNNGAASNWKAFREQAALMFNNAMLYNQEESQIYMDAKSLLKQLDNKIAKYSQIPKHLEVALTSSKNYEEGNDDDKDKADEGEEEDEEEEEEDADSESSGDMEDDDEDVGRRRSSRAGDAQRYDDEDDDDFEADSEDLDEEDLAEQSVSRDQSEQAEGMQDPNMMVNNQQFMQPAAVYDEIVYRAPGEGLESALLRLVTLHSTPIPSHMAINLPIEDVKRAENDIVQIRIPPSPTKVFTTFATTIPYYQSTLRLTVFPNTDMNLLQVTVLLNGAVLAPLQRHLDLGGREYYDVILSPGLNQLTVIAIKASFGGYIRQYGPPPLAESDPDEERMVLFLNLSK